jgi:hypothetical protein
MTLNELIAVLNTAPDDVKKTVDFADEFITILLCEFDVAVNGDKKSIKLQRNK